MAEVKALFNAGELVLGENILTLTGTTCDGNAFEGSQVITVVDNAPSGAAQKR